MSIDMINQRLREKGSTVSELSRLAGTQAHNTRQILAGKVAPKPETLHRLLRASLLLRGERGPYERAQALHAKGISVIEIAAELRVDTGRVRRWIRGEAKPRGLRRYG